mgnify:CR=1 FL=1
MSLPKRYVWFAVGAAGAMGLLYLKQKMGGGQEPAPESGGQKGQQKGQKPKASDGANNAKADDKADKPAEEANLPAGTKELTAFLAGESWFDEMGWHTVWERAGIETPEEWLKNQGLAALKNERAKLQDHPALLAGCRRRWIVVCRYAGIDVADAAQLWNGTEG